MNHPAVKIARLHPFLAALAAAGALGLLAGCNIVPAAQDDPTRYFVLSDAAALPEQATPAAGGVRIGLKSVRLEGYLKRREMVVRAGDNEVEFRDYRRWAEPLDAAVGRALRGDLLASPGVAQVQSEPFALDQDRDFDVFIEVRRCEGALSGPGKFTASFTAMVEVSTAGANPHVVSRKLFVAPDAAWDGRDYDRLAGLLTADVSALGREILSELPARN
jgi:uncharacterized lipoprotein YmbA